jgi:hypothetical protein
MPRNASGTYTLPSGNPVVSGTLIDATWANNTMADLGNEVTDSLSRSGEGAMLAPLRIIDGVQATPSLAFSNEPSSGLYRAGTNEWWSVAAGVQVQQHTSTGAVTRFAAGAVGTPSISAFGDVNTGIWFPAADTVAASVGGVEGWRLTSTGLGVGTTPTYKFHVAATASSAAEITSTATTTALRLDNTNAAGWGSNLAIYTGGVAAGYFGTVGSLVGSTSQSIAIWATSGNGISLHTNGSSTAMAVLDTSGNFGIGGTPAYKLDVRGVAAAGNGTYTTGISWSNKGLIGTFSNHTLGFLANGAELMFLDTAGNLGLGVSPSVLSLSGRYFEMAYKGNGVLSVSDGTSLISNAYYDSSWKYGYNGAAAYYANSAGQHRWYTAPSGTAGNAITFTQAMTLTAAGDLGVGQTSPLCRLDVRESNRANSTNIANVGVYTTSSPAIDFGGSIALGGRFDSGNQSEAPFASIRGAKENSTNANYSGYLAFQTIQNGNVLAERARITSGGYLLVNTTTASGQIAVNVGDGTVKAFYAERQAAANGSLGLTFANSYTNWTSLNRYVVVAGGSGGVYLDTSATSWTSNSDERLKTDLKPIENASEKVSTLRAVTGRYITDEVGKSRSFLIAQDVQKVLPEAVNVQSEDDETLGLQYTDVIPLLVAAIKEQAAMIKSLEAKASAWETH